MSVYTLHYTSGGQTSTLCVNCWWSPSIALSCSSDQKVKKHSSNIRGLQYTSLVSLQHVWQSYKWVFSHFSFKNLMDTTKKTTHRHLALDGLLLSWFQSSPRWVNWQVFVWKPKPCLLTISENDELILSMYFNSIYPLIRFKRLLFKILKNDW